MHTFARLLWGGAWLLSVVVVSLAQVAPTNNTATGVVTGVIKIGDTPAANIALTLNPDRSGLNRPGNVGNAPQQMVTSAMRVTTDASGQYRFTNVAAGRYRLDAQAEAFVGTRSEALTVGEAQTVTAPDLSLTRGGVITGRVTGNDNRPLIAQRVNLSVMTDDGQTQAFNGGNRAGYETDDRGIYRVYGLPAGRYLISAGEDADNRFGRGGGPPQMGNRTATRYARTYHPDAVEAAQAQIIEITTGKVAEDIDIRMGEPLKRYVASGRVVDSETGQPIAAQIIAVTQTASGGRGGAPGGFGGPGGGNNSATSDANGGFIISGLVPGNYAASLGRTPASGSDFYGSAITFQVVNSDVSGLTLSVKQGASITGVVILDGVTDPAQKARLAQTMVMANVRGNGTGNAQGGRGGGGGAGRMSMAQVSPDGSFRISGLTAGRATLNLNSFGGANGLSVLRVESNGAVVPAEIELTEGQQFTGLRIIAGIGNGVIRGQVVVQGTLAANTRLRVTARALSSGQSQSADLNAQGQFRFTGLLPGSYELTLTGNGPTGGPGGGAGGRGGARGGNNNTANTAVATLPVVKQVVTVTNGAETPAVLTLNITQ